MRKYGGNTFSEFELIVKELYRVTKTVVLLFGFADQTIKGDETAIRN